MPASRTRRTRAAILAGAAALAAASWSLQGQTPRYATIQESDLRTFMNYIASDELLGRQTFTEGYGLAAAYVAARLREWGVKPLGDAGSYLQAVKVNDVRTASDNSSVTVDVAGQSRTFKNGEGVQFAAPAGGKQTVSFTGAEFLGYGLFLQDRNDYAGRDVKGKPVIWISGLPGDLPADRARQVTGRARHALLEASASASMSYVVTGQGGGRGGRGRGGVPGSFSTTENFNRLDRPQITGDDSFFELLFTGAPTSFAEIKARAVARQPLPAFSLPAVKLTFQIDTAYQVVQTRTTHNVVGLVQGTDPKLRDTYVLFGAHLDHEGYATAPKTGGMGPGGSACPNWQPGDLIYNGADDDGSGIVTELAIAKAFATGPKPKRSLVFVWHAGEEQGMLGSRYNADFPVVPIEKIDAQLNMDMMGRDEWDNRDADFRNSVYIVGDDRISTELHNLIVDANAAMKKPLELNYGMNDPADPEAVYYRSDHYGYAAKGIPIAFFTTGLHADYHCPSDTADRIHYEKMARIGQLVYQTAFAIANKTTFLERDNQGPRSGRGFQGKIAK